jgi:glycine/D-amino acid oxidase-like deaminating enzyme
MGATTGSGVDRYRSRSLWLDTCGDDLEPRPSLAGDTTCDVAVVGGGMTGLWTARLLRDADPALRITVLEAEICGFGASGRNGGWCSALFPTPLPVLAARAGRAAAVAQHRAMVDTVAAVGDDLTRLGIDARWSRGGTLSLATDPSHVVRLRRAVAERHEYGFDERDDRWLTPDEVAERVRVRTGGPGATAGAAFTPHCAALDPARLTRGLARSVEADGVAVHEGTRVRELRPGAVATDHGSVRAEVVLRCTEGYTASLAGHRRELLPLYSMMIATEPLPPDVWDAIGLAERETFTDGRRLLIYGQRTEDGRLAFGGRGAPYHFGSRIADAQDRDARVATALTETLHDLFPITRDAQVTHHWGGPLGVPRDWTASVGIDRSSGIGWAGGYVGDGVSTTHLAARTLRDLVLDRDTDLRRLPWVGHRSRRWEPEPLRWLGVNAGRLAATVADQREARTHRASAVGRATEWLTGGH